MRGTTAQAEYRRKQMHLNAEIGPLPDVVDPARRDACKLDLKAFCLTYFPELFYLEFGAVHNQLVADIQETILKGSLKAVALPRSSGKTTICQVAILWALLYGHRRFAVLIAAETTRAVQLLQDVRLWLETNELINADFPEAAYPFKALENVPQRARTQTLNEERTRIEISAGKVVFPYVRGSVSACARMAATGLTSSTLRGLGATTADGKKIRPDIVLIDDPSTAESARSYEQNNTRERLIKADVLGMAGAGKKIACLITCTVIADDDLASRLLDRKRNPEFKGTRVKLMPSMPDDLDLWRQYNLIRIDDDIAATEFYKAHREQMDKGAQVSWSARYNCDEVSAIQNAMNIYFRDEKAFLSEYQNTASSDVENCLKFTPAIVGLARTGQAFFYEEPFVSFRTAFIDCHNDLLYYSICGWSNDFRGQVLAFGSYPEQTAKIYRKADAHPRLMETDAGYQRGIIEAIEHVLSFGDIRAIGVDIGFEQSLTRDALASSPNWRRVVGVKGAAYGAKAVRQIADYKPSATRKIGNHWLIDIDRGRRTMLQDVTFWKTRLYKSIVDKLVTINGDDADLQQLFNHLQTEHAELVTANNKSVYEWIQRAGDNHLFDCLTGCMSVASFCGARFPSEDDAPKRKSLYNMALKANHDAGRN